MDIKNFILQSDLIILSGILHHHQIKNMLSLLYVTYRMGRLTVFITLSSSSSRSAELIDFSQMYRVSSNSSASIESEPSCGTLSIMIMKRINICVKSSHESSINLSFVLQL